MGVFCILTLPIHAQKDTLSNNFVISGKIFDPHTQKGISYAHIIADQTRTGSICDSLGFFKIKVAPNQNLQITAIGFGQQKIPVPKNTTEGEVFLEIPLKRESYLLEEVMVYSLGTWEQFKYNFINSKTPKNNQNIAAGWQFPNMKKVNQTAIAMKRPGAGISVGISGFSRKDRSRLKVAELKKNRYYQNILNKKYNSQIVSNLTGESGKRLDILMVFINSRHTFTYQTKEYYICQRIKEYYKEFLETFPQTDIDYALADPLSNISCTYTD